MTRIIPHGDAPPAYPGIAAPEKVSVGQTELFEHYTLLIPKGEPVHIPVRLGQFTFGMDIEFDDESEKASVDVLRTSTGVKITFLKWHSALGTALYKPVPIISLPGLHLPGPRREIRVLG